MGKTLTEMAAAFTPAALRTLAEIMQDRQATATARVAAANSLLDRAHGKPLAPNVEVDPADAPTPFTG